MILCRPIAKAVQDHLLHDGVITVQRISAAAEIIIIAVRRQHIINIIVKSFKRETGPQLVALRRMVEHHVQDTLNPVFIQRFYQFFQFRSFPVVLGMARITGIGSEKTDRIVSPVVHHLTSVHDPAVFHLVKLEDRHQLHRIDAQFLQIRNLFLQSRKGARVFHTGRFMLCKSPHVQFIDHQILHRDKRIPVLPPVKHIAHHPRFVESAFLSGAAPYALPCHRLGINIQQHVLFVKQKPLLRIIRSVQTVCVLKFFNVQAKYDHRIDFSHPVMLRERDHRVRFIFHTMEQQQFAGNGAKRVHGKVHSSRQRRGSVQFIHAGTYLKPGDLVHGFHMDISHRREEFLMSHTASKKIIFFFYFNLPLIFLF